MRVLVTGATGFSGRSLVALLEGDAALEVHRTSRSTPEGARSTPCDLTDAPSVKAMLAAAAPEAVYHLAGAYTNDWDTDYRANVLSTRTLLESLRDLGIRARVLLAGSAAEYGPVTPADNPIAETRPLRPTSVYGLCKAFQTQLMGYYCGAHGMDIVMARAFNLHGPGASPSLLAGRVHAWLRRLREEGGGERLSIGRLDQRRDYLSVDDAARRYRTIMQRGARGEVYNVGAGRPTRARDLVVGILAAEGVQGDVLDEAPAVRGVGSDIDEIYADITKLVALGA